MQYVLKATRLLSQWSGTCAAYTVFFNKGHLIRDSTQKILENKGHGIHSVLSSRKIRDSQINHVCFCDGILRWYLGGFRYGTVDVVRRFVMEV